NPERSVHTTTKPPAPSGLASEESCAPVASVLTWNSVPPGVPSEPKRRAWMLVAPGSDPAEPSLVHGTTKPPAPSGPAAASSWTLDPSWSDPAEPALSHATTKPPAPSGPTEGSFWSPEV